MGAKSPSPVSLPGTLSEVVLDDEKIHDTHCLEKRVYYKVISGTLVQFTGCRLRSNRD
jgi:ERO1-like protein beta